MVHTFRTLVNLKVTLEEWASAKSTHGKHSGCAQVMGKATGRKDQFLEEEASTLSLKASIFLYPKARIERIVLPAALLTDASITCLRQRINLLM